MSFWWLIVYSYKSIMDCVEVLHLEVLLFVTFKSYNLHIYEYSCTNKYHTALYVNFQRYTTYHDNGNVYGKAV